jgi:hypothetical protein
MAELQECKSVIPDDLYPPKEVIFDYQMHTFWHQKHNGFVSVEWLPNESVFNWLNCAPPTTLKQAQKHLASELKKGYLKGFIWGTNFDQSSIPRGYSAYQKLIGCKLSSQASHSNKCILHHQTLPQ